MQHIVIKDKTGTKHRIDNVSNITIIGSSLVIWTSSKDCINYDMSIVEEVIVW